MSSLTNEDLAPVPTEKRTWNTMHFAALWVGMAVCIPTYTLAAGLIDQGMSWWQALLCVGLGNVIVLIPMILNAHAGTKYGIPFPVFARASFGTMGANVPAILRALVACGWFGIQTWFGGLALWQLAYALSGGAPPSGEVLEAAKLPILGATFGQLVGFAIFWAINVFFIVKGTESIKWLETWAAPFLIVSGLGLLAWAWTKAGGFGPMLSQPDRFDTAGQFMLVFAPGLTAMVGFWATLSLNIPDFTRYAKSQKDQVVGQALGLPTTMLLFAFIGVAVTSATKIIFGETIWDPVTLTGRIGATASQASVIVGALITVFCMIALSIATLSTNLAANVVSPANDFSNVAPSKINYVTGGLITAVIGAVIMPWRILETSQGYIFTWLVGYSALLGPVGGIMIADYFLVRRTRLNVDDLYRRGGEYEYRGGVNWLAITALVLGAGLCLPGFLTVALPREKAIFDTLQANPETFSWVIWIFRTLYTYAWFVGFLFAGAFYWLGALLTMPKTADRAAVEPAPT